MFGPQIERDLQLVEIDRKQLLKRAEVDRLIHQATNGPRQESGEEHEVGRLKGWTARLALRKTPVRQLPA